MRVDGSVHKSTLNLLLRDFDTAGLDAQKEILKTIINKAKEQYPKVQITLTFTPQYRNMREVLEKNPQVTERLESAVRKTGVKPIWKPIRGGTDGSKLTALGLPTPNIFTGSCNSHSLTEWQSVDAMVKAAETVVNLVTVQK
jgi:tripeptide aminopeptidase